jgi:hypothetical protein
MGEGCRGWGEWDPGAEEEAWLGRYLAEYRQRPLGAVDAEARMRGKICLMKRGGKC